MKTSFKQWKGERANKKQKEIIGMNGEGVKTTNPTDRDGLRKDTIKGYNTQLGSWGGNNREGVI